MTTLHSRLLGPLLLVAACSSPRSLDQAEPPQTPPSPAESDATPTPASPQGVAQPAGRDLTKDLPESGVSHYGVYLNGHKVGWMRSRIEVGATVEMNLVLEASVGGLGTVSKISLEERRSYRAADGALLRMGFSQQAATGSTRVEGEVRDGQLHLEVTAGNRTSKQSVPVAENLEDALATIRLAAAAKMGATRTSRRFDPSILAQVEIVHRVLAVEERVLGGVTTKTIEIESTYPSLKITESAKLDETGTVLESKVGGFFVARLEPPDVAKRLDYSQDLLVSAVVPPPAGMAEAANKERIGLTFTGFGDAPPPSSARQQVRLSEDRVELTLTRDNRPTSLLPTGAAPGNDPYLAPTPFIQSDSPAIGATARKVVGDAKSLAEASERLTRFVFSHVRDEYVPAYSNALEALESGRGDCTEHSILFVALARSLGIPSRVAVGIAYWPRGAGFGWHAWAEVRDGERWISVDPTWNQPIADVTHVKLADGGPAEQARIVMLLGQLRIVDAEL